MRKLFQFVDKSLAQGRNVALATLIESEKHTPGQAGNMMAVLNDGEICGTIGGGAIEHAVIKRSLEALKTMTSFAFEYDLSKKGPLDMVCGGWAKGFVNMLYAMPQLVIFGAGHIGEVLSKMGRLAGFKVTVVDEREDRIALIDGDMAKTMCGAPDEIASSMMLTPMHFVVIVTHGHVYDYRVLRAVVEQHAGYVGMIGSSGKVGMSLKKLREEGVSESAIQQVYTPIGLSISDGSPEEISIAIMAEILSVKNGKPIENMKHRMRIPVDSDEKAKSEAATTSQI